MEKISNDERRSIRRDYINAYIHQGATTGPKLTCQQIKDAVRKAERLVYGEPRRVYFINQLVRDEKDRGYLVCIAVEGESGFYRTDWNWGSDLAIAERLADEANERMGISKREAMLIQLGTMFAAVGSLPPRDDFLGTNKDDEDDFDLSEEIIQDGLEIIKQDEPIEDDEDEDAPEYCCPFCDALLPHAGAICNRCDNPRSSYNDDPRGE